MTFAVPRHGGQLQAIANQFGIAASELLDFSANINPDGPPPGVLPALRAALDDPAPLTLYPDLEERQLKQSLAHYVGIEPDQIAVANGFVPLLDAALRQLRAHRCLLPVPAFTEYRSALERAHVQIVPHPLMASDNFRYDAATLLAGDHDVILLANPQNPSGVCTPYAQMIDLVARAAEQNIFVLLDEAFIDFSPHESLASATTKFRNLIVFRSVTKFHGMPGLRVAYAVTNPALAAALNEQLPPWPITTLASRAVCVALADVAYVSQTLDRLATRKTAMVQGLHQLGIEAHPSSANFLLFQIPHVNATHLWRQLIAQHHIVLRNCADYESLPANYLRAAIRTESENGLLVCALGQASGLPFRKG